MIKNHKEVFDKYLALEIFLDAFKKAGVQVEENQLKTPKAYEILAREIIAANDLDQHKNRNLPNYIKDRFNSLKKLLDDPEVKTVKYTFYPFNYIRKYARGEGLNQQIAPVLFTRKPYSYFNFWRMPKQGILYRSGKLLTLVSEHEKSSLENVKNVAEYSMSRDRVSYWVKLTYGPDEDLQHIFFMSMLKNHRPQSSKQLFQILTPFINGLREAEHSST